MYVTQLILVVPNLGKEITLHKERKYFVVVVAVIFSGTLVDPVDTVHVYRLTSLTVKGIINNLAQYSVHNEVLFMELLFVLLEFYFFNCWWVGIFRTDRRWRSDDDVSYCLWFLFVLRFATTIL